MTSLIASAQTQQGVAYQYNGKNARTPLGNVTISYDANRRSTVSAENGNFVLTLTGKQMGDRIGQVTVKKREMMVFNQQAVDEWSIRKEPLRLILCNADEFEKQKEKLIAIGRREARMKYDKLKTELEAQLNASKIKEAEYEATLEKAYDELGRLNKNISEYADLFARIDESEIDTLAQQAVELFNQGEVEKAIMLFEQGHYLEKLSKAITTSQQADQLISVGEQAKAKATQDSLEAIESLKAQIEAYKVNNEWQKAGELLKGWADRVNTTEEIYNYVNFCLKQQQYEQAEIYCQKLIQANDLKGDEDERHMIGRSVAYNTYSIICLHTNRHKEAEIASLKALSIQRQLMEKYPYLISSYARTISNLATNYMQTHKTEEAGKLMEEAQAIFKKLSETGEVLYIKEYCQVLNAYGILNESQSLHDKALKSLLEAEKLQRKEAGKGNVAFEQNLGQTLITLGNVYSNLGDPANAEKYFNEAKGIFSELYAKNPDANISNLFHALLAYGFHYRDKGDMSHAIEYLSEAITLMRPYAQKEPAVFSEFAGSLNGLGAIYMEMGKKEDSKALLEEALALNRQYPVLRRESLSSNLTNLAVLYMENNEYGKAEDLLKEAIENEKVLQKESNMNRNISMCQIYNNLGVLYSRTGRTAKSFEAYEEGLAYQRMEAKDNRKQQIGLAGSLLFVGSFYLSHENIIKSYALFDEAYNICKPLYEENAYPEMVKPLYFSTLQYLSYCELKENKYSEAYPHLADLCHLVQQMPITSEEQKQNIAETYNNTAYTAIMVKKYAEAEEYAKKAISFLPAQSMFNTNLAAALLLQGKMADAEPLYRKYKNEFKDSFLDDFNQFTKAGIIPKEREEDVKKILQLLNE